MEPAHPHASAARVRILLVDDHPIVRAAFRDLLETQSDLRVCGEAAGVGDAFRGAARLAPDLVIIDLRLPDGNGLDLIKRIRALLPQTRQLVVSMYDEAVFAERALAAGALGYVGKDQPWAKLLEAIRQVLAGRVYLSERMSELLLQHRAPAHARDAGKPRLSDRELEVFEAVGLGRSTREIASGLRLSIKTIETHRENIKRKLGLASGSELIRRSWQWVLEGRTGEI